MSKPKIIEQSSSIKTGGTAGQVLMKNSGTDYDTKWADVGGKIEVNGILKGDGTGNISAAVSGTDYVAPSSIRSITFDVPAFTTSTTVSGLTGVTANTVATFGLASTATSAQYAAAAEAQLLVTGQASESITITAIAGSLSTSIPCVLNIMK